MRKEKIDWVSKVVKRRRQERSIEHPREHAHTVAHTVRHAKECAYTALGSCVGGREREQASAMVLYIGNTLHYALI